MWAIPAANSGAMVESAPTDSWGAEPRTANATVPGDEDVEPRDGGHPGQARRRQLLGDGDRQQREPGQEVGSQPLPLVPVQRAHEGGHLQPPARGGSGRHGVTASPSLAAVMVRRVRRSGGHGSRSSQCRTLETTVTSGCDHTNRSTLSRISSTWWTSGATVVNPMLVRCHRSWWATSDAETPIAAPRRLDEVAHDRPLGLEGVTRPDMELHLAARRRAWCSRPAEATGDPSNTSGQCGCGRQRTTRSRGCGGGWG